MRSFVRVGQIWTVFLVYVGREDPSTTISGPLSACQQNATNGVSLAGRLWPCIKCWLGSLAIFQGTQTCIARKPYIFAVFFFGGDVLTPAPLWIHACILTNCFRFLKNHYNFQIYLQCPLMPSLGVAIICLFYDIYFFFKTGNRVL